MKSIQAGKYTVLVDDEDYKKASKYAWCVAGHGHVHARVNGRNQKLCRLVLDFPSGQVKHLNGDKLDNRKSNLIVGSHQQSTFGQKLRSTNRSGYRGVSWDTSRQKWYAHIMHNGKTIPLGRHNTKEDAAIAYNVAALELFGEFATINILSSHQPNTQESPERK